MTENGTLTPKQHRAITALLTERDIRSAATAAGVGERTLWRWLGNPVFRAFLAATEGEVIDAATRRLLSLQDSAIDALEDVLKNGNHTNKRQAAQAILDTMLKVRELRNIESRLAALEAAYHAEP